MSTAIGHGLADPKRRGKPVSQANKGWRSFSQGRESRTCAKPESKGNPVKIPEPEGWTGWHYLLFWCELCEWVKLFARQALGR